MSGMTDPGAQGAVEPDFDDEYWIEVPLSFPMGPFATPAEWASTIAAEAIRGDEALRERVRQTGQTIAEAPRAGVARRFWYFPLTSAFMAVVDHFALERTPELEEHLVEMLAETENPSTEPVVTELDPAGARRLVRVARLAREEDAETGAARVYGVIRVGRVTEEAVEILEAMNDDLSAAASMMEHVDRLAAGLLAPAGSGS